MAYDNLSDLELLALCIWREARGEPPEGQRAVAWVIQNRRVAWKQTWRQVILAKNQFTSMTYTGDTQLDRYPKPDSPKFIATLAIAENVMSGFEPDPTNGSLYYRNPKTATSRWFQKNIAEKMTRTVVIGRHEFFRP